MTFLLRKIFSWNTNVLKFLMFDKKAKNHTLSFSHSLQLFQNKLWLSLALCNGYIPHSCIKTLVMSKASTSHHCLLCACVCTSIYIHTHIYIYIYIHTHTHIMGNTMETCLQAGHCSKLHCMAHWVVELNADILYQTAKKWVMQGC